MRSVLIIAYYFPPSGGPGVQRVLKHVKYLPEFGWEPVVLTVDGGYFPARDETLLEEIPDGVRVHRAPTYEPYDLYRLFTGTSSDEPLDVNVLGDDGTGSGLRRRLSEWIRSTFFIPDARIGWLVHGVGAGEELCEHYDIDAIYSSSPPYTVSVLARQIRRRTGLPWLAELRDPWTEFLTTPDRWWLPAMVDRYLERTVLEEADAVACAWEGIIDDAISKYPHLSRRKFHHVPNGFDSADFPDIDAAETDALTITYTGSMYGQRNPRVLFEAIERLIGRGDIEPGALRLKFVGRFGADILEVFEEASFSDAIEVVPYVPHEESIAYLLRSDALLLVVDDAKESRAIVPGKVYEYVGVQKPIIALAEPESAVADLLAETQTGLIAPPDDVEACADILLCLYRAWKRGEAVVEPDAEAIGRYERREAARQIARVLTRESI